MEKAAAPKLACGSAICFNGTDFVKAPVIAPDRCTPKGHTSTLWEHPGPVPGPKGAEKDAGSRGHPGLCLAYTMGWQVLSYRQAHTLTQGCCPAHPLGTPPLCRVFFRRCQHVQ